MRKVGAELAGSILNAQKSKLKSMNNARVAELAALEGKTEQELRTCLPSRITLRKSVWIIGGDSWAYDVATAAWTRSGFRRDVNVLVLDTSYPTLAVGLPRQPRATVAKFAPTDGTSQERPWLDWHELRQYLRGARGDKGGSDNQTLRAFVEADSTRPSLIIAYSHCINHGIDMSKGLVQRS